MLGIRLLGLYVVVSLLAAQPVLKPAPPTAESILDQFTKITGGEDAYRKVVNEYMEAITDLPGVGRISARIWFTAKSESRTMTTLPDGTKEETGVFGGVAWAVDGDGARILSGLERELELHDAIIFPHELWRDNFAKAEYLGLDAVRSESCYRVRLTPKRTMLKPELFWFSVRTGLLVKTQGWTLDEGKLLPVDAFLSDYRKTPNGLLVPHRVESEIGGMKISMSFEKVVYNSPMRQTDLRYPARVASLIH